MFTFILKQIKKPYFNKSLYYHKKLLYITDSTKCQSIMLKNCIHDNSPQVQNSKRIVWFDAEMTGLDPKTCHLLEVACIITDHELNTVAEGPNLIINQPDEVFANVDEWIVEHHGQSGLIKASKESKISLEEAEVQLMDFVKKYVPKGESPLAGNSVYVDKIFLLKYMPRFASYLHYRIIDVSTIKELVRRWYPNKVPKKAPKHRALDDIKESIDELKYYRKHVFK